jgi:glycosyltransferase involved in cell wall biosynthesis
MAHLPHFYPLEEDQDVSKDDEDRVSRPYFLVVGRLERLKGVQTLIDVFRRYGAADLVVVGEGTYGDELRRQAADVPNIRFLGRRPSGDLRVLYRDALALLAPSLGYETFGMTTIEAFAERTPAIVRERGGLPEVVLESGGGFTYRTETELVEAMEALRSDPRLRNQLGERGHRAYRERWSPDPHVRAYFDLIEHASDRRAARTRRRPHVEGIT